MVMKLHCFLQIPIVQLFRKFHWNILTKEDNFRRLTLEKSPILEFQLSRKKEQNYNTGCPREKVTDLVTARVKNLARVNRK